MILVVPIWQRWASKV